MDALLLKQYMDLEMVQMPVPEISPDEVLVRVTKTHTLQRRLDPAGIDVMADNLRGLTEEEAERAISQAARHATSARSRSPPRTRFSACLIR